MKFLRRGEVTEHEGEAIGRQLMLKVKHGGEGNKQGGSGEGLHKREQGSH